MKNLPILFLLFFLPLTSVAQGTLVEDTIISHLTIPDIEDILSQNGVPSGLLPTDYEVDVHRVIYNTPDPHGNPTVASGIICLPSNDTCPMPMMSYLHGTKALKTEAFYYLEGEWWLGVLTATSGYAVCLPDYLGLGAGPGIHYYQHAESEATASIDIMRACRIICDEEQKVLNNQLFLIGYSQGGHSVMATHRKIQQELSSEFTVTASAPGSGPYDMSGSQLNMVASFDPYSQPGYLPFLIQSYQEVYGNLYTNIEDIYVSPYDETLPPLLDGSVGIGTLNQAMPEVPRDIIQPDYADVFFSDTTHPAYLALKDNNVYDWVPESPVMFNYCRNDEQVTYLNTIVASEYMIAHGASDIQVIERDTVLGHFECAEPSIIFSKFWFDTMAEFCVSENVGIDETNMSSLFNLYPNPVTDGQINFSNEFPIDVQLRDVSGRILLDRARIGNNGTLQLNGIKPGIVLVDIYSENFRATKKLIVQ